jgi:hypothetical protein
VPRSTPRCCAGWPLAVGSLFHKGNFNYFSGKEAYYRCTRPKGTPRLNADEPEPNGVIRVNSNQQKRIKLLSAVIGASAVVAVGAVGVAVANERAGPGTVSSGPGMTLGPTTTTTTPPAAPVTSLATPTMTATTPAGFR